MKFRNRILVCVIIFFSLAFGIGGGILTTASFISNLAREKQTAANSYQMVLNMLSIVNDISTQAYYIDIVNTLEQLEENGGGSWAALRLSDDDNVVYSSSQAASKMISLPVDSDGGCLMRIFRDGDIHYLQISGPLRAGTKQLYLDGLYNISNVYEFRTEQQNIYRYVFVITSAAGFVALCLLTRRLTRPLQELSDAAREITEGNLERRVKISSCDEVGRLAQDFNEMTENLVEHIEKLEEAMNRQEVFMGSFAHELKTPMTSIIGYADLLRSQELTLTERRDAANYIFSEGKRLENLSLKLLDLLVLRHREVKMVYCSPAKLIQDAAALLKEQLIKQKLKIKIECEEGNCMLEPALVKSLAVNLIDNARKSMEQPGMIRVIQKMTPQGCLIRVEDEGRGIPPEEISRVTEAFYRVDKSRSRAQGGAGLGLSLCLEIVKIHGGDIRFEAMEKGGTAVTAELKGGRQDETAT